MMTLRHPCARSRLVAALLATAIGCFVAFAASAQGAAPTKAATLTFGGKTYQHRWSKAGQNEFTPQSDADLSHWNDMVTINVHSAVGNGEQLADVANRVLSAYQSHGKVVRTNSRPRTPTRPAEHLIVALLGGNGFVKAAFARLVLV